MSSLRTCQCITKSGIRCKNKVKRGKYCNVHKNCGYSNSLQNYENNSPEENKYYKIKVVSQIEGKEGYDTFVVGVPEDLNKLFNETQAKLVVLILENAIQRNFKTRKYNVKRIVDIEEVLYDPNKFSFSIEASDFY
jgi:RNase H-fold protein (predicted Holliday junction resolvase)